MSLGRVAWSHSWKSTAVLLLKKPTVPAIHSGRMGSRLEVYPQYNSLASELLLLHFSRGSDTVELCLHHVER